MPLPQFTQGGNAFTPFTFEKARFAPIKSPIIPAQDIGKSGGGALKIINYGDAEQLWELRILRVTPTNKDNLLGFLADATVNYAKHAFTFIDEDSNSETVRCISKSIDFPQIKGGLCNIILTVRKEIT